MTAIIDLCWAHSISPRWGGSDGVVYMELIMIEADITLLCSSICMYAFIPPGLHA